MRRTRRESGMTPHPNRESPAHANGVLYHRPRGSPTPHPPRIRVLPSGSLRKLWERLVIARNQNSRRRRDGETRPRLFFPRNPTCGDCPVRGAGRLRENESGDKEKHSLLDKERFYRYFDLVNIYPSTFCVDESGVRHKCGIVYEHAAHAERVVRLW